MSKSVKRSKGRRPVRPRFSPSRGPSPFVAVPDLDASLVMRKRIRYALQSATGVVTITNQTVADFLAINVDAIAGDTYRLALAVRIIKISLYASNQNVSATYVPSHNHFVQYISTTAAAPFGGPAKIMSANPISTGTAVVHARPPPESYAAQWINCEYSDSSAAIQLAVISCTSEDVVDITYEFVVNTSDILTSVSAATSFLGSVAPPIRALCYGGTGGLVPQNFAAYA